MRRPSRLDLAALALLGVGVLCVPTGLLPLDDAAATLRRVLPILLFLGTVIVLAELIAAAEVFDVVAVRLARIARGRRSVLFVLVVALTSLTTMLLNLDTTAVLLTPVLLAVARSSGLPRLGAAMTAIWLANTASLLLPVSNLTNLLAADRVGLTSPEFAVRMLLPQLAAVLVTAVCLWICYWRPGAAPSDAPRLRVPEARAPKDQVLFRAAAGVCAVFLIGVPLGAAIEWVSTGCVLVLAAVFWGRRRSVLRPALLPWRLVVLVTGMFLTVQAFSGHGLDGLLAALLGRADGTEGIARAAATGAGAANLLNNLPVYVAAEAVVGPDSPARLLALLIGVNAGPLVLPWASLATLLCLEHARRAGVEIPWGRFVRTGAATAFLAVGAATAVLVLKG